MLQIVNKIKTISPCIYICLLSFFAMEKSFAQMANIDEVKAAFVQNFIGFTTWPFAMEEGNDLRLCTISDSPLSGKLERLNNASVHGYQISTHFSVPLGDLNTCNVIFIQESNKNYLEEITTEISNKPILTVSDSKSEVFKDIMMINLKVYSGRIRFNINLDIVRKSNLALSSQLLNLAEEVMQ